MISNKKYITRIFLMLALSTLFLSACTTKRSREEALKKEAIVLIDEKNFNNKSLKEKSKIMSYVPQITSSFDIDLTVFDTVLLGRVPHKTFKFSEWDK